MMIRRWDPFREARRMDSLANRFWRAYGVGPAVAARPLPLDVFQQEDEVVVRASLPGVKSEDVEVTFEDGVLRITASDARDEEGQEGRYLVRERRIGKAQRALRLPDTVDADRAETTYADGVLTITFPKVEAKKAKRLEIKAS